MKDAESRLVARRAKLPLKLDGRSTLLRKSFRVDKPIRQARVFVTGLGYYELSCNGERVEDRVLPLIRADDLVVYGSTLCLPRAARGRVRGIDSRGHH